jgi:hypothetical protein
MKPAPLMLKVEPNFEIDLNDITDPMVAASIIDREDPMRAIERTLKLLPNCTSPSIDTSAPAMALKKREQELPQRASARTEHDEPNSLKSKNECGPPNRLKPRREMLLPMLTNENTLMLLPNLPIPHRLRNDPHLAVLRRLHWLPI